jgi:hypothetical protein
MVTWAEVVIVAPELSAVPMAVQTAILAQVAEQLTSTVWGTRLAAGQTFLAAHLGTVRGAPNYQQEQVGDHSRQVTGDLESTSYGREFRRLLRTLGRSVAVL